jgi:ribosomal protein L24
LTPKEISYFQENTSIQEFVEKEQSNLLVKASVREGQLVKCLAGDGIGLTGRVKRIQDDMVTFDSFSHGKFVAEVTEHLSNICPVFKKGDQVLVGSGLDVGKEGVVVDVADRHTTILTKNDNQLTVLTKLLTHRLEGIGLQPPTM